MGRTVVPPRPDHRSQPPTAGEYVTGLALVAGAANVIMQLSRRPVGRGVVESKVDAGRLDLHPVKRARTTLTYLAVALLGTDSERAWMRSEVGRAHRLVRSDGSSPVAYSAFDPALQLWVAACLYKGYEDACRLFYGELDEDRQRELYRDSARFGTTLQVTEDMWPADRQAFAAYWAAGVRQIETDPQTRAYLRGLAELRFLPAPIAATLGSLHRVMTVGFLPPEFRDELGYSWTAADRAVFGAAIRMLVLANRALPRPARQFPLNLCLWDYRRRMRAGRAFV